MAELKRKTLCEHYTFAYTGREWEQETGDYYYRARYYDPNTGRFLSQDPIGFLSGDFNLYNYVLNNPIKNIDSSGLIIKDSDNLVKGLMDRYWDNPRIMKLLNELHADPTLVDVADANVPDDPGYVNLGSTYPSGLRSISINIDLDQLRSQRDIDETVLHELIHARNKINGNGAGDEIRVRLEVYDIIKNHHRTNSSTRCN